VLCGFETHSALRVGIEQEELAVGDLVSGSGATELAKLSRLQGAKTLRKSGSGFGRMGSVPPKYRNPQNPAETWAERGLTPKWLAAAIKGGKSADDFLIAGAVPSKKANGRKKVRKPRK
jgi:DNA-binding protein H-NS